jgi:putative ABC transport system ATP-binding protein
MKAWACRVLARMSVAISVRDLEFRYAGGPFCLRVDSLRIDAGSRVGLVGPSGSGKTTLLQLVSGIELPQQGCIEVGDLTVTDLTDAERRRFRIQRVGSVFQEFELLEYLDVLDNILLPYRIHGALELDDEVRGRAIALAESTGIGDLLHRGVRRLSQGERQRVAICRALLPEPDLLLADEPTGNLDPKSKDVVFDLLLQHASTEGATLIAATHDHGLLGRFDRVVDLASLVAGEPA